MNCSEPNRTRPRIRPVNSQLSLLATCLLLMLPSVSTASIAFFYDFEGNFNDQAGVVADHLTPTGGSLVTDAPANAFGSTTSYSFANGASYETAQTDAFSVDLATGNAFTLMFWFKGDDLLQGFNNTRLISMRYRPDGQPAAEPALQVEGFGQGNPNGLDLRIYDPVNNVQWFAPHAVGVLGNDGVANNDVWHHVAFVISNQGSPGNNFAYAETFVDGVSVGLNVYQGSTGAALGNTQGELIVGGHNGAGRGATGKLDDVALFNGVLSRAAIRAIASGRVSPGAHIFFDDFE